MGINRNLLSFVLALVCCAVVSACNMGSSDSGDLGNEDNLAEAQGCLNPTLFADPLCQYFNEESDLTLTLGQQTETQKIKDEFDAKGNVLAERTYIVSSNNVLREEKISSYDAGTGDVLTQTTDSDLQDDGTMDKREKTTNSYADRKLALVKFETINLSTNTTVFHSEETYDYSTPNQTKITLKESNNSETDTTELYDNQANLVKRTVVRFNTANPDNKYRDVTDISYLPDGNISQENSNHYSDTVQNGNPVETFWGREKIQHEYDSNGLETSKTEEKFDLNNQLSNRTRTLTTYGTNGGPVEETIQHDALGDGTIEMTEVTTREWDEFDNNIATHYTGKNLKWDATNHFRKLYEILGQEEPQAN